jgi:hypothetical protein
MVWRAGSTLGKHLLAYKAEGVRLSVLPFCVGYGPPGPGYPPKRKYPILSSNGCLPGAGEKPVASVVWRLGSTLLEIPRLLTCVGVAPLGRPWSAQPLPWLFPGPMGDAVCQGRLLRWFVRVTVTAPNASIARKALAEKRIGWSYSRGLWAVITRVATPCPCTRFEQMSTSLVRIVDTTIQLCTGAEPCLLLAVVNVFNL